MGKKRAGRGGQSFFTGGPSPTNGDTTPTAEVQVPFRCFSYVDNCRVPGILYLKDEWRTAYERAVKENTPFTCKQYHAMCVHQDQKTMREWELWVNEMFDEMEHVSCPPGEGLSTRGVRGFCDFVTLFDAYVVDAVNHERQAGRIPAPPLVIGVDEEEGDEKEEEEEEDH